MPPEFNQSPSWTSLKLRRSRSSSPVRHGNTSFNAKLNASTESTSGGPDRNITKMIRRGRKPSHAKSHNNNNNNNNLNDSITTADFQNSFNSSTTTVTTSSSLWDPSASGTSLSASASALSCGSDELDFLSKSPAGHQWRNKKHWQTNANAMQRRYLEYSGKPSHVTSTPQGIEREMRRLDIRASLLTAAASNGWEDLNVPDL